MPTKTELVAELEALRRELSEARAEAGRTTNGARSTDAGDAATDASGEAEGATDEAHSPLSWAMSQLEDSELDRLAKQFIAELEGIQQDKPLVTVFAAFVLGYVLGRAR